MPTGSTPARGARRSTRTCRRGTYRFLVVAQQQRWDVALSETTWDFAIAPMFYQTTGSTACVVAALGARAVGRVAAPPAAGPARVRAAPRRAHAPEPRDSRHAAAEPGRRRAAVRRARQRSSSRRRRRRKEQFVRMRKQVEEYIREARQSIWDLRSPTLERRDLAAALREVGEQATERAASRLRRLTSNGDAAACARQRSKSSCCASARRRS